MRMLLRSAFPTPLAKALVRKWAADLASCNDGPVTARAWQVSDGYTSHRDAMVCRYAAFTARFAPTYTRSDLEAPARPRLLIAVPIAVCDGKPVALVPTRAACFAIALATDTPLLAQMRSFSPYLPCHEEPQQLHITRN